MGSGPQVSGHVLTRCSQMLLTSASGRCLDILWCSRVDLARHIQIWTEQASPNPTSWGRGWGEFTPSFWSHASASSHAPRPPPPKLVFSHHLWRRVGAKRQGCTFGKGGCERKLQEKRESSASRGLDNEHFGPDHTIQPTSKSVGDRLVGHRKVESNHLPWEQHPRSRCIKASAGGSNHSSRNHAPRGSPDSV